MQTCSWFILTAQELTFLKGGFGVDRKIIAYNFFIIVGPANNLAGITSTDSVSDALVKIYNAPHTGSNPVYWFSRNDASGTNTKEISLWQCRCQHNWTKLHPTNELNC